LKLPEINKINKFAFFTRINLGYVKSQPLIEIMNIFAIEDRETSASYAREKMSRLFRKPTVSSPIINCHARNKLLQQKEKAGDRFFYSFVLIRDRETAAIFARSNIATSCTRKWYLRVLFFFFQRRRRNSRKVYFSVSATSGELNLLELYPVSISD